MPYQQPAGTVLILTHPRDVHADAVQHHLTAAGVDVYRTDTYGVGTRIPLVAQLENGVLTGRLGDCELARVRCVWHRRPSELAITDAEGVAEAQAGLGGILSSLPHLNHPADMARASLKPLQLLLAGRHGLQVPATVVSTQTAPAAALALAHPHVITKPMSRRIAGLVTTQDRVAWSRPVHLTQEQVDKVADIRLTVVDQSFFAVRIDSPHFDWRADLDACSYQPVEVPSTIRESVSALLAALRLRYAAIDFALATDGQWWFLEANPNGQWLWLEQVTHLPIATAVATALSRT